MLEIILGIIGACSLIAIIIVLFNNRFELANIKIDKANEEIEMYLSTKKDLLERTRPIVKKALRIKEFMDDIEKINLAYDDINKKLNDNNRNHNYWVTAKLKLRLCLDENEEVKRIAKILDLDMKSKQIKNKIVVSVIFGKSSEKINEKRVADRLKEIRENDEKVIIVCIRENTIKRTLSIIEELSNNG